VVALETRLGETSRLHQIEADHIRSELSELVKRVDTFERPLQTWSTRLDTFEEMSRRGQEATTAARQRVDEVDRYVETVDGRIQRLADVIKRVDGEFALLVAEVESMQKQDSSTADRFHAYAESLRRLEDEIAVVAQQSDVRREFTEKFELQRSGIRRSEERLNLVEATADDVRGRLEDFTRSIALIEAREGNFRERLNEIFEAVAAYRAHLAEYFNKVTALDERQRRRRIEDLEREIRELKVHAYRPPVE